MNLSMNTLHIQNLTVGPDAPLTIIAGPCTAESYDLCVRVGEAMNEACGRAGLNYIFKASFDKANRSSIGSPRGPGLEEGLALLERVRKTLGTPVTTDIHESHQAAPAAEVADVLQIPAFLCRQTDLLVAAAATGKVVNVKKGQFLSPAEMGMAVKKLTEGFAAVGKSPGIILTERGTFFGYHRLVNDFGGLVDLMAHGHPVCFDATHSTQKPGESATTGGRPELAPILAKCAVVAGVQAVFMEVHPDPKNALSDAATMLDLPTGERLVADLAKLAQLI